MTNQADSIALAASIWGRIVYNLDESGARFVEEAAEAGQACGVPEEVAHRIIRRVYSRPAGELRQEIGGSAFTLAILAEVSGYNAAYEMQREVERVASIDPAHFRAKHAANVAAGTADITPLVDDVAQHAREPWAWSHGPSPTKGE